MSILTKTVPQRLAIFAALVASILLVAYPAPAFYRWSESESSWYRTSLPELNPSSYRNAARRVEERRQLKEELARSFLLDYDLYGRRRPDFRRVVLELAFIWLVGVGFSWAVKPNTARPAGASYTSIG